MIIFLNAILSWIIPKKIIICSKNSINVHRSVGYKNNFELIHNGFDPKIYRPIKNYKRENFGLKKNEIVIGNVARYHTVKNQDYLLSIFSKIKNIPNIKLVMIGTNIDKKNLDLIKKIKKHKIKDKVILLGRRDDVFHIYKFFDIFLLTSLSEGFPNVLAEAMLNKNICFSTDVGDSSLIMRNKNFIIPKHNVEKSVKIIKKMIQLKYNKKWKLIKKKNREHIINKFSLEKMVAKYSNVWKN